MGGSTSSILFSWCINSRKSEVKFWFQLCFCLTLLRITEPAVKYSSRIVETRSGLVRGIVVDPERKRLEPVEIFYSIPYCKLLHANVSIQNHIEFDVYFKQNHQLEHFDWNQHKKSIHGKAYIWQNGLDPFAHRFVLTFTLNFLLFSQSLVNSTGFFLFTPQLLI